MKIVTNTEYKKMLLYGVEFLKKETDRINALNVFPVPDGDTGTNMNMTMQAGAKPLLEMEYESVGQIAKAVSKGMLFGARGNSGVILSQFFRGLAESLEEKKEINVKDFIKALSQGRKKAYASVINAVEGTILTVIKDLSLFEYEGENFLDYFDKLIIVGEKSLDNTPNLLPVLKEVGVVDSGGAGLMSILYGMQKALNNEEIEIDTNINFEAFIQTEEHPLNVNDIIYGYCTEMLIKLEKKIDIEDVRNKLESLGDSIVAIEDDGILKTHVHTEKPIEVLTYGRSLGDFIHVKSENMRIQAQEKSGVVEEKENGLVIVAPSKEMAELFKSLADVEVILGGQTLNPSTEDIVKAIKLTNAKNVIMFPNNSNIIMATESASELLDDINLKIVKTKYMTQGLECLINYNPDISIDENYEILNKVITKTTNYEITNAIKDTHINGINIKENDYLVLKEGKIINSVANEKNALDTIVKDLDIDNVEILTVLLGADANKKLIKEIGKELEDENPFLELQSYDTNQPIYSYLIIAVNEE